MKRRSILKSIPMFIGSLLFGKRVQAGSLDQFTLSEKERAKIMKDYLVKCCDCQFFQEEEIWGVANAGRCYNSLLLQTREIDKKNFICGNENSCMLGRKKNSSVIEPQHRKKEDK